MTLEMFVPAWKPVASLEVEGVPVPQGSLQAYPVGRPPYVRCVIPQDRKVRAWRDVIAQIATAEQFGRNRGVFVESGPLCMVCRFVLPRPKSASKSKSGAALAAKRPDLDKLTRAIGDALEGIWYKEDSQSVEGVQSKRVAEPGIGPGVTITLYKVQ